MDTINRRRGHILIGTGVSLITCIGMAAATELSFLDVSQPFYQPNGGIEIHRVTYAAFLGSPFPGQEIRHLAAPNCIVQGGGQYTFLDSASRDQNVASRLGVQVTVEYPPPGPWKEFGTRPDPRRPSRRIPYFGVDTLGVEVDLSRSVELLAAERGRSDSDLGSGVTLSYLAEILVACIRDNATRSQPAIRFVRIRFSGAPEAGRHSGVYRVPPP